MAKFGYQSVRKMEPRPGKKYATDYYKQSTAERRRTVEHIERSVKQVGDNAQAVPGGWEELQKPLREFPRRETKGYYSAWDIMSDMINQIDAGKDIPSGCLGRWNKLFDGTGREIDMVRESELPPPTTFGQLFGDNPQ